MKHTARIALLIGFLLVSVSGMMRADDTFPQFGRGVPRYISWHPDGQLLFVHTYEESLWIYDAATLEALKMLPDVRTVQSLLPDRIFVVTKDNTLTIYDLATLEAQHVFSGVEHVIPTPVNDWLLVWQNGVQSIRRTDAFDEVMLDNLQSALFSPDGKWLLTLDTGGEYTLYDAATLTPTSVEFAFDEPIHNLRWSDDSEQMTQITPTGQVYVWEIESGVQLRHFDASESAVYGDDAYWSWSPDGAYLLNYKTDGNAALWDVATGEMVNIPKADFYNEFPPDYYSFYWTPDSQHLFQCIYLGDSFKCNFIEASSGEIVRVVIVDDYFSLNVSPDGRFYVWGDGIYDANTLEKLHDFGDSARGYRTWSRDSSKIAIQSSFISSLYIFDLDTRQASSGFNPNAIPINTQYAAWSPDGTLIVTWDVGGQFITLWDVNAGNQLATTSAHAKIGGISALNSAGTLLAVGDAAGRLYIRDAETDILLHHVQAHAFEMTEIVWQPGGTLLATSIADSSRLFGQPSDTNLIHIWDGATGELIDTIEQVNEGRSLAWSPSGDTLVVTDGTAIYAWDAISQTQIGSYETYQQRAYSLSLEWSRNGRFLLLYAYTGASSYEVRDGRTFQTVIEYVELNRQTPITDAWTANDEKWIGVDSLCRDYPPGSPPCRLNFLVLLDTALPIPERIMTDRLPRLYEFGAFDSTPTTTWSADAERLLTFADNTAQIWQVGEDSATLLHTFEDVQRAEWDASGRHLLLAYEDHTTIVDALTGEPARPVIDEINVNWQGDQACYCETDACAGLLPNPYENPSQERPPLTCVALP